MHASTSFLFIVSIVRRVALFNPAEQPSFGGSLACVKIMIVYILFEGMVYFYSRSSRRVDACINHKERPVESMLASSS
jgi:hypothetical protein